MLATEPTTTALPVQAAIVADNIAEGLRRYAERINTAAKFIQDSYHLSDAEIARGVDGFVKRDHFDWIVLAIATELGVPTSQWNDAMARESKPARAMV